MVECYHNEPKPNTYLCKSKFDHHIGGVLYTGVMFGKKCTCYLMFVADLRVINVSSY